MQKLKNSRVAIFGIGGVGGHTAEALVRSGVGTLYLIDSDKVSLTNLNRQIFATHKTIGEYKVDAAKERLCEINPEVTISTCKTFFTPEASAQFDFKNYDYVVDAIDTVTGKIELTQKATLDGVPIISAMGAGNKLDPTLFEVTDIYKTSVCPLARVMRRELKKRGIKKLKVVCSKEEPVKLKEQGEETKGSGYAPASTAFVPSVAGLIIAGEVIKDITDMNRDSQD